jgi:hypothetical protein
MLIPAVQAQEAEDAALKALVDESSSADGAIALARRQASSGDITGAAATLERALLADPNANDVRIWYAGFLCQLDDPQGARIEVANLDKQNFGEDAWNALVSACGPMERPAPATGGARAGVTGEVAFGLAYDSDSFGAQAIQLDTIASPKVKADGLSAITSARINGHSQGYYDQGGVYGGASVRALRSLSGPARRYGLGDVRLGYGRQSDGSDYSLGGVYRYAWLLGRSYVNEYGGQASVGIAHSENSRVALRGEAVYQNYSSGVGNPGDGWRYDLGVTWDKTLAKGSMVSVGAAAELKNAKSRENAYRGGRVFAYYQAQVGDSGQYFNLTTMARFVDFKKKVPLQSRNDARLYARAAYGVPLVEDRLFIEGAASYTHRSISVDKTVPATVLTNLADYGSFGAELRLVWKFGK